jgi:D-alanyl-D-alanine carboxypeptidase
MLTNQIASGNRRHDESRLSLGWQIRHDAQTSRPIHQARAITVQGAPSSRTRPRLRAPLAGCLLSLLFLLSPDLTLAPISAGEPLSFGVQPVNRVSTPVAPRHVYPVDFAAPVAARLAPRPAPSPSPSPAPQPSAAPANEGSYIAAIEAARAYGEAYGVTFAAVRDGEVLWSGAAGRYRDGATALGGADALVIGSVTKTFVSAAVLQLVEEGRLSLGDTVREHLPQETAVTPDITIRQLLDHTSGLADVFNDTTKIGIETHPEHAWSASEIMATLHAPWYAPGQGWAYANTNYYLLGLVIERITGATLADELEDRFFRPLRLDSTSMLTGDPTNGDSLEPAWASIFWASGAMSASAADLARWGDALYSETVLSEASRAEMMKLNEDKYGLGVQRIEVPGTVGYGHTGMLKTYTSMLLHLPTENVTLALLVNRTHVDLGGMLAARPAGGPSLLDLAGVKPATLVAPAP